MLLGLVAFQTVSAINIFFISHLAVGCYVIAMENRFTQFFFLILSRIMGLNASYPLMILGIVHSSLPRLCTELHVFVTCSSPWESLTLTEDLKCLPQQS